MRSVRALSAIVCCLVPIVASAQTNRGGIEGTIFDPSGATVPGATVIVTNVGTGQTIVLTASAEGRYAATLLEPVTYRITVEASGFKQAVLESVKVDTSTITTANVKLELGDVTTEVTVTAQAEVLNAGNGTISHTVSERQITDLPLADRSVLNLMLTLPNITGDLISETPGIGTGVLTPGQGLSVSGGRPGSTSYLANGVDNTAPSTGRTVASFSPDTVQEFTVQTSNFSAEYGQTTGGIVNLTTKSGTNRLHGTGYFFRRAPELSAAPFTIAATNRPVSNLEQKETGFTVGGPVFLPRFGEGGKKWYTGKDRTFFFFAFEPRRISDSSNQYNLFPTEAMRNGDFSNAVPVNGGYTTLDVARRLGIPVTGDGTIYQLYVPVGNQLQRLPVPAGGATYQPFPGNILPLQFFDPTALRLLQYLPPPNRQPFIQPNGSLANWVGLRNVNSDDNRYQFRIDHQISQSNRLSVFHSHIPIVGYRGRLDFSLGGDQVNALISDSNVSDQWVLSDTQIFSPTSVNELRVGYIRGNFSRVNPPRWQTDNFATQLGLPSITTAGLPWFTFGTSLFSGVGQENITSLGNQIDEGFQIADTLTKTHGNMTFKLGTDLREARLKTEPVGRAAAGEYDFSTRETSSRGGGSNPTGGNAFAGFLLGVPEQYQFRTGVIPYYYRWASGALFLQDDWRVRPNLTLNLGMRYALQIPRWESNNAQAVFLPDLAQSVTLTDTQRRAVASAWGVPATSPIPGNVPASALVPPFAFNGRGGRSRYLTPIDWNGWEPRFGFAWTPKVFGLNRVNPGAVVVRGGYGVSHSSLTGLGSAPSPDFAGPNLSYSFLNNYTGGQANPAYDLRLSSNPAIITPLSADQVLPVPGNGLVYDHSLRYSGFVISKDARVPRSESWNLTTSWSIARGLLLELSYSGNRGSHLFLPPRNLNLIPFDLQQSLLAAGIDPASTVNDPLGRTAANGTALTVTRGSLGTPYLGFGALTSLLEAKGNSIRHAGSLYLQSRMIKGLTYTVSYTYAKSMDDGSDAGSTASPNIFTNRSDGYIRYGLPQSVDWSVSTFDIRHAFSTTFLWDVPVGSGRTFWENPPAGLDHLVGGWSISGVGQLLGSYPFQAFVQGGNGLDNISGSSVRMNVIPGVPFLNPQYDPTCPIGNTCQPYINPSAFIRPAFGQLGTGPRTYDNIRGPMRKYLDLSLQKNFYVFKDRSKRIQLRVDVINVLNRPNFRFFSNGPGGDFSRGPGTINSATLSAQEYDSWAASNGQPLSTAPAGAAIFQQVQNLIVNGRIPGTQTLPVDFFSIPVPTGFLQQPLNSFDIRTLEGIKLYRLRGSWNQSFGTLGVVNENPRRIQYLIKFIF